MPRLAALATVIAGITCSAALSQTPDLHRAQYGAEAQVNVGDLLVANEKLGDPNFAETVVLITQRDEEEGTVGLVINRRSEIPLSRVFPDVKGAGSDPVYVGGPVSLSAVQALLRLSAQTDEATHIAGDVYASGSKQIIEKSVRSHIASSKFRLYVGYAGWGAGQLESKSEWAPGLCSQIGPEWSSMTILTRFGHA
jgi:putative transcriptional regulator